MQTPTLEQALAQRDEARELVSNLATYALSRIDYGTLSENDRRLFDELVERVDTLRVTSRTERNATQRALDVANADREALRALLNASAERVTLALFWLDAEDALDDTARTRAADALRGAL
jgi:hypothetical protein